MAEPKAALRKGDRTRERILSAARELFAANPYDKVTIRAIAAQAEIDPAMVMRYYTNKETLFALAVDVDLQMPDLSTVPRSKWGAVYLEHLLDLWEGPDGVAAFPILARSALAHESAAERVRQIFAGQARGMLETVMPADEAARRAGLVASQTMGLVLVRYLLKLPGIADRPAAEVVADIAPTVQRYLTDRLP